MSILRIIGRIGALKLDTPNPIDVRVGSRVRLRRNMLGLSQESLGEAIGLSFQQVQKYERGTNRIGASRLYALSQALDVPVAFFFDEAFDSDPLRRSETLELVDAYYAIDDAGVRRRLLELARALMTEAPQGLEPSALRRGRG